MTHFTEQQGFPQIPIQPGMTLRLRALAPTTDAEVAGVTSSQWSIYGRDDSDQPPGPPVIPPLTPEQVV